MNRSKQLLINLALVSVICLTVSFSGCTDAVKVGNDFLDKPPSQSGTTQDSIFSDPDLAKRFLWHTYKSLPYGPGGVNGVAGNPSISTIYDKTKIFFDMLASLTDLNQSYLTTAGANNTYYHPQGIPYSNNHTKYNYNEGGAWDGIRQAYIFINNIDRVPDMSQETKDRLKGEARMIIALQYTDLFRNYGGVPWINKPISPNDNLQSQPRLTAKATVDSIVGVMNRAIDELPFTLDNPNTESGRFTKAAAMGLKARLLLFAASPLFNSNQPYLEGEAADEKYVWYGSKNPDGDDMWQDAVDACKAFIDANKSAGMPYHLADTGNPREDFRHAYYDRTSPEVLISTRYRYRSPGGPGGELRGSNYYYGNVLKGGTGATTDNYVKMFPMADGTPIDDPNSGYDPAHPYENRDPRLYETVLVNGDRYQSRTAELWIRGRERETKQERSTRTSYRMRKFILDGQSAFGTIVHFPYLRLPEIYLSYAEALNEENGAPNSTAYEYVNKVRERVGLDDLPTGMSQEEFRNAVLRERALELGYEEVRWYDIVRWKRDDIFKKTLYGMNICKKSGQRATQDIDTQCADQGYGYNESSDFVYAQYKIEEREWKNDFSPKWYLGAFPKNEVNKGYGLVQNPGWE